MSRFWAVGVGPGDPGLLTLKAVEIVRSAHILYHAGPEDTQGRALEVVRGFLPAGQPTRTLLTAPMAEFGLAGWRQAFRPGVERIAADWRSGLDVVFVTEGDPTLYSTASYVWLLLAEMYPDIPIEIVPGVSSLTAAAARVGWPLTQKKDTLAVVPAAYHADDFSFLLECFTSVGLLKVSTILPQLLEALEELPATYQTAYVENVGTPGEWVTHDLRQALGRKAYFSLVLVRRVVPGLGASLPAPRMSAEPLGLDPKLRWFGPQGLKPDLSAGKLCVIGLGPGDVRLLTPAAREALELAEVLLGYTAYLDLLRPLGLRGELRGSAIGTEAERAAEGLRLAAAGRRVALVSSGDAGVYGMAGLVLETAAALPEVEVEVIPGVTAAVAAAALLGAPLGHDFACVSLSDLLTPWPLIETRLQAAGQGDFVLALYNPCSQRRTWQLPRARDILLQHRRPETPVGLVDRAHRPGMRVWQTTLGELSGEGVGMETLLIVGNSQTRVIQGRMVTPRGYGDRP